MILKVLLVLAVIGLVYFMFIKKKPVQHKSDVQKKKDDKLESNDMVACSTCGTYTELSETLISANKYYCSDECVDKA